MGRPKKTVVDALAIIAEDLLADNQSVADVGLILGTLGQGSLKWLEDLKEQCTDIDEFLAIAKQRADIALIAAATKEAMGYDYTETDYSYINRKTVDVNGVETKTWVATHKKERPKRARPNDQLLRFLLRCRLPEYFTETQKIEINKKTIEIKQIAEDEIRGFGQKLIDAIDAEEAEFEPENKNT